MNGWLRYAAYLNARTGTSLPSSRAPSSLRLNETIQRFALFVVDADDLRLNRLGDSGFRGGSSESQLTQIGVSGR